MKLGWSVLGDVIVIGSAPSGKRLENVSGNHFVRIEYVLSGHFPGGTVCVPEMFPIEGVAILTKMEKRVKVADVLKCEPFMFYTQRVIHEESGEDMMEIVLVTDYDLLGGGNFESVVVARFGLLEGDLSTIPDEIIQKYTEFTGATCVVNAGKYTFYLRRIPTSELKFDKDIYGLWTLSSPVSTIFQSSDENIVRRLYKALK